jgi:transcriptional regulator of heat shock response
MITDQENTRMRTAYIPKHEPSRLMLAANPEAFEPIQIADEGEQLYRFKEIKETNFPIKNNELKVAYTAKNEWRIMEPVTVEVKEKQLQKIAEEKSNEIRDYLELFCKEREYIQLQFLKALIKVRDAQEEKIKHIKEELEVALGKCQGSLEYPVGTILKQLISKIGGGE